MGKETGNYVCPNPDRLRGIPQIKSYAGKPWAVILDLKEKCGFPVRKIGGNWESWKQKIDKWFMDQFEGEI
jgi:hypothetical protein